MSVLPSALSADDHRYMARALQLAARGLYSARPNPRVGSVLVRDGIVVGEGWHERAGEPHAEIHALRQAGERARGATCYVTLEPCCHHGRTPPCTQALIAAGVTRVVAAMSDPNPRIGGGGLEQLRAAGVDVRSDLLAAAAETLNVGFGRRMRTGRPWLRAKVGMSLDGRIATASGESRWITSPAARRDVQRWRARSCAVMTGIGTVLADNPELTVREPEWLRQIVNQPLRVVIDSRARIPPAAKLLQIPGKVLVMTAGHGGHSHDDDARGGVEWVTCAGAGGRVDLNTVLSELGRREVNEVLLEAGPTLTGALLEAGLVDELICYLAPRLLGDRAQPMARLPDVTTLAGTVDMAITDTRQLGEDVRLILRPVRPH